jgi:hypothetical protein
VPTTQPSRQPAGEPTSQPSASPSKQPNSSPSASPIFHPTGNPTSSTTVEEEKTEKNGDTNSYVVPLSCSLVGAILVFLGLYYRSYFVRYVFSKKIETAKITPVVLETSENAVEVSDENDDAPKLFQSTIGDIPVALHEPLNKVNELRQAMSVHSSEEYNELDFSISSESSYEEDIREKSLSEDYFESGKENDVCDIDSK